MQEDLHARLEDTITKEKGLTSTAAIGVSLPLFHQKLGRALNVICQLLHRSELQNVHFDVSSRCMYVTCMYAKCGLSRCPTWLTSGPVH